MRKAFDANVPKLRPRLKAAVSEAEPSAGGEAPADPAQPGAEVQVDCAPLLDPAALPEATAEAPLAEPRPASDEGEGMDEVLAAPAVRPEWSGAESRPPTLTAISTPAASRPPAPAAAATPTPTPAAPPPLFLESPDISSRRERLDRLKRKVAEAARPAPPIPELPESAARAGASALALVRDLEERLDRARELEEALRADLDATRAELARGAAEGRRAAERMATVERQLDEKRGVLEEMLAELSALEAERDGAVARAQALAALDEERQGMVDELAGRAEAAEKARDEARGEADRLAAEQEERAADAARLRAALAQVTRERDDLAREAAQARAERDGLSDAKRALEQVHEALASARARLG